MDRTDKRTILIVLGLILVANLLEPGPLRSKLEIDLILAFIPGLGFALEILELLGSGLDTGSLQFYLGLFKILLEAYITERFWAWIKPILPKRGRSSVR